jgi:hypothetical protein
MRPGGERIKSPLYMLVLRRMNWSAEHRQEADHMAPLTGIHAYFINNKPIYSAFLADVEAQGGSTDPFSPTSAFPDGYFTAIPWVGVVVQKDPDYEGDTAAYKSVSVTLNGQTYPLHLNSAQSFETGATGYFHSAPAPQREDYFGVPPLTGTEEVTVTLLYDDVPYQNTVLAPVEPLGATTKWSDIILNYGNLFTDDVRNQEAYDINPAAFLNTASYYLQAAIPRFNRPTEIISYLSQRTPSFFSETQWAVPAEILPPGEMQTPTTEPITIQANPGYELCSVVIRGTDKFGNPVDTPYSMETYDPQTGKVTFPAGLISGTEFIIDLYRDGVFQKTLSPDMKRILGLCFHMVWEYRFTGNWLARSAKVSDKSFDPPNEANWTRAQEEKRRSEEDTLNQELRRYEQACTYRGVVNFSPSINLF